MIQTEQIAVAPTCTGTPETNIRVDKYHQQLNTNKTITVTA